MWEAIQAQAMDANTYKAVVAATLLYLSMFLLFKFGKKPIHWMDTELKRRWRARSMKQKRRKFLKQELADAIVDYVEDKVAKGKWQRHEADVWYLHLGRRAGLTDLLPSKGPEITKQCIAKRLVDGTDTEVPLPDLKGKAAVREVFCK